MWMLLVQSPYLESHWNRVKGKGGWEKREEIHIKWNEPGKFTENKHIVRVQCRKSQKEGVFRERSMAGRSSFQVNSITQTSFSFFLPIFLRVSNLIHIRR